MNFNPFKKKEKEYKLDNEPISNVSGSATAGSSDPGLSSSSFPGTSSAPLGASPAPINSSPPAMGSVGSSPASGPMPASSSAMGSSGEPGLNPTPYSGGDYNPSFNFSKGSSSSNSYNDSSNSSNDTTHQDISKAKLEAIDSKVALMNARLDSIEQKIEIIGKILMEEVSEETKRKVKVKNMMESMKSVEES